MAANVQVIGGVMKEEDGLKSSQVAFRKHHKDVGDALLNISGVNTVTGGVMDKDDPRPDYHFQAWPKMMYHADGRELIAINQAEAVELKFKHFREQPYPKPQIAVGDAATEKQALLTEIKERDAKLAVQNEMLLKMMGRLEALEAKQAEYDDDEPQAPAPKAAAVAVKK